MTKKKQGGKIVATRLTDAEYKLFCEVRGERTSYEAMKDLIQEAAEKKAAAAQDEKTDPTVIVSGKFESDVQRAEQKPLSTLEKILNQMTGPSKSTDTKIKRHGAYHDENTLIDIMNMIKHGRPTMLEIKWVIDTAYVKAVVAEAIIRKGAGNDDCRAIIADFEWRPEMQRINPLEMARRNPRNSGMGVIRDG